jgi:carboxyl-terminal processing protease
MTSRTRWAIFLISTPLVVLIAVGGLLGATSTATTQASFPQLRVFEEVVSLVFAAYVEEVDVDKVMDGAMRGLADSLDPPSAYLSPREVEAIDAKTALPPGRTGLTVTRQFWTRVIGVRDGSPADRAGLRTGDFIRMIDDKATRDMSAIAATNLLAGAPGSKVKLLVVRNNPGDPHEVTLTREALPTDMVTAKKLAGGEPYVRIQSFGAGAAAALRKQIDSLGAAAAKGVIVDIRGVADGEVDEGIAAARHFIKSGAVATLAGRNETDKTVTSAGSGDGALAMPVVLLVSNGTANGAEVFAAALAGAKRATLVGEPTAGLAARQRLVRLPEGHGLWMTYARYLQADGKPLHGQGLRPEILVEPTFVPFGEPAPAGDPGLDKAVERLKNGL